MFGGHCSTGARDDLVTFDSLLLHQFGSWHFDMVWRWFFKSIIADLFLHCWFRYGTSRCRKIDRIATMAEVLQWLQSTFDEEEIEVRILTTNFTTYDSGKNQWSYLQIMFRSARRVWPPRLTLQLVSSIQPTDGRSEFDVGAVLKRADYIQWYNGMTMV